MLLNKKYAIKILRCSDPNLWYANKVGQTVPLYADREDFWSREDAGYYNIVFRKDAELVLINDTKIHHKSRS